MRKTIRMQKIAKTIVLTALLVAASSVQLLAQSEGGGTSGADFLLSPPVTRTDAMGGALDAYGDNLEMILLNPALLTTVDNFNLQVNISPLPNSVTNAALSVGTPLFGGVGGVGIHFFNVGQFNYYDPFGQASAAESVYDAALAVGYSYPVWGDISTGMSLKAIYRVLGTASAFAVAGDLGASMLFEVPYIGQPPKAPTYGELEREFVREKAALESGRDKELKAATALSIDLQGQIESTQGKIAGIEEKLASEKAKEEPNAEKIQGYEDQASEQEAILDGLERELADAKAAEADAVKEIDDRYRADLIEAKSRFNAKVLNWNNIANERARLFSVITDPDTELEDAIIDANIDDSIKKTNEFLQNRIEDFRENEQLFRQKRHARRDELQAEIDSYAAQIDEELGPANSRLTSEIEDTQKRIDQLEASKTDENKDTVNTQVKELKQQLSAAEKELAALQSDPWIKRLRKRIETKEAEIEAIAVEIEKNAERTNGAIEDAEGQANRDIQSFENLRVSLKKELKRTKLKRELDLVDARTDQAAATARDRYLATESRLYQQLLAAMYSNEEKIFQERLNAIRLGSEERKFDYETEYRKSIELLEEDYAFQERLLNRKINDLKKAAKESESETEDPALAASQDELEQKSADYDAAREQLSIDREGFLAEESDRVDRESDDVRDDRRRIRLIFLQTDDPYKNTSLTLAVRNLGTNVKFETVGYPMPVMASLGLSYGLLNIDNHSFRLSVQADMPLRFSPDVPFYQDIVVGVGGEYTFFDLAFVRAGYTFNSVERNFSAGFGMKLGLGFTEYAVDYTFMPLPDYGFVHNFAVSISF